MPCAGTVPFPTVPSLVRRWVMVRHPGTLAGCTSMTVCSPLRVLKVSPCLRSLYVM